MDARDLEGVEMKGPTRTFIDPFIIRIEDGSGPEMPARAVFFEIDDNGFTSVTDIIEGTREQVRNVMIQKLENLL